jgi:hypothetical protein
VEREHAENNWKNRPPMRACERDKCNAEKHGPDNEPAQPTGQLDDLGGCAFAVYVRACSSHTAWITRQAFPSPSRRMFAIASRP